MLPRSARLTRSEEFTEVVRRGRRSGRRTLVVHVLRRKPGGTDVRDETGASVGVAGSAPSEGGPAGPRVGFLVSRAVGNAVTRNRVKRRLRHLVRERLDRLPAGALLAVRALPPAAAASSRELATDLDDALDRALAGSAPGGATRRPAANPREVPG